MNAQNKEGALKCIVSSLYSKDPNDTALIIVTDAEKKYELKMGVGRLLEKGVAYSGACFDLAYNKDGTIIIPDVKENERKRKELAGLLEDFLNRYDLSMSK